jgi:hypothetical protein
MLKRAKITEIYAYIKKNNMKISVRTIQRCIASDPRIKQDGWYYSIDDKARFENRYMTPKLFGGFLFSEFMRSLIIRQPLFSEMGSLPQEKLLELLESRVKEMVNRFGVFMIFTFLEAVKPFRDKSMTQRDRNDLVDYWAMNAVPLAEMFMNFRMVLHNFKSPLYPQADTSNPLDKSRAEMLEGIIEKVHTIMKDNYPDTYDELANIAENKVKWKAIEQTYGKRFLVRGKTLQSTF